MITRRSFLTQLLAAATAPALLGQSSKGTRRVCVIGHTGRGNYGHGLDVVWNMLEETSIVAVADANEGGLAKAKKKLGVDKAYADYREMLQKEKPELVAVCPRHVDQRVPMITAACEAGAKGIYVEKPFVRSPKEGDQIAKACAKTGTKLAVAHRNRYHPVLPVLKKLLTDGLIGEVLELRGRGKEDRRGGGEDLWVLGTHVFDLFNYLAGKPITCSAEIREGGQPVAKEQVYEGNEGLGPLAGDEIHARWRMSNGWTAYFDSVRNRGRREAGFGLQVIGNKGVIDIRNDREPLVHFMEKSPWEPAKADRKWVPVTSAGVGKPEPREVRGTIHNHIAATRDLIAAIKENRAPKCDLEAGRMTAEFACSVFESHRKGGKTVAMPLKTRVNPLTLLT
ncbi:MAG: 3-chlorobenzoate-3,4-dioxygenase [Opitutae bacterium]|nr:3-chlorobenzoate-3,4-dioxygenase [Opitutae bacterium]